jgi:hypothetical protein
VRFLASKLFLPALLACAFTGCRPEEGILQETIRHEDRQEMRMRIAIVEHDDFVLFIRIDGPAALVAQHKDDFDTFVKSTRFPEKKEEGIQWSEPKGWKKDPPIKGRDATYRIDAKPKELEVKISRLPSKGYHLLPNMHRWQKQIDMPLSEDLADTKQFVKEDELGKRKLTWVDLKGLGVHVVTKPLDPKAQQRDILSALQQADDQNDVPFTYKAPEGWKKAEAGKLAIDAYEVTAGGKSARITITPISGAMITPNVNRWREQVGLGPLAPKDIAKESKAIQVAGIKSTYVDIMNKKGPPAKNHIIAVIVPINPRSAWSIVISGPTELVEQNKKSFETFIESFKQ